MRAFWERAKRDWRVRTTIPIVAIHVAAFSGIYLFTYQFAMSEIKSAFRIGASHVLEEAADIFSGSTHDHRVQSVREGLSRLAESSILERYV